MNDYPFGYLGLKTEACQQEKKKLNLKVENYVLFGGQN